MKKQTEDVLTIGKLAEECDVTIDTIRYYERFKLMQAHDRTKAGYRLYGQDSVRRLMFIKRSKDLGFTLDEIRTLLALKSSKRYDLLEMLELPHARLKLLKQLESYHALRKALIHLLNMPG